MNRNKIDIIGNCEKKNGELNILIICAAVSCIVTLIVCK